MRMTKRDARFLSPEAQAEIRLRVINAVRAGMKQAQAALGREWEPARALCRGSKRHQTSRVEDARSVRTISQRSMV